jgi:phosphoglycolate phosphatase
MTGDGLRPMLQRAFAATGAPLPERGAQTIFQDFLRFYQNQKASLDQLYPQAIEIIKDFRAAGVKIGLCTNKLYLPTIKLLDEIGIRSSFDFVAGGDTFSVYKPHPGHVLGVAHGLKVPPQNCAMVGDSINDIRAAQAAEIPAIAVAHGYAADTSNLGADAVINGFDELRPALRRLGFDIGGGDVMPRG